VITAIDGSTAHCTLGAVLN